MNPRYHRFDSYIRQLTQDVYAQPIDPGHQDLSDAAIARMVGIANGAKTVLDVGCGQGVAEPTFRELGLEWTGVTLGEDYRVCKAKGLNVYQEDMSFLSFEAGSFDLVYARHVLEHSPFPILTLMEWARVASGGWLILIAPTPYFWGWKGRNHYSITTDEQLVWWLERAGWFPIFEDGLTTHDKVFTDHISPPSNGAWQDKPEVAVEYWKLCEIRKDGPKLS
jgi:SAM-dependent methyltransferase